MSPLQFCPQRRSILEKAKITTQNQIVPLASFFQRKKNTGMQYPLVKEKQRYMLVLIRSGG